MERLAILAFGASAALFVGSYAVIAVLDLFARIQSVFP